MTPLQESLRLRFAWRPNGDIEAAALFAGIHDAPIVAISTTTLQITEDNISTRRVAGRWLDAVDIRRAMVRAIKDVWTKGNY